MLVAVKPLLLALAVLVGATVLYAPTTHASAQRRCGYEPHPALMTVRVLRMYNQPIGRKDCALATGPVWDLSHPARPGEGETMVIDGHDVTPVPGYDGHGPFYRLYLLRPGDLATIRWKGVRYTYRFVTKPFARRQCLSKYLNYLPARLAGKLMCIGNDKPIKEVSPVESFYIRCCWPRYTREKFLYERAVLIRKRPA
jgi:hypothetical protein